MLKILFIGDIVGAIGREATKKLLPKVKQKYKPDLVIANAENIAHGKGVTKKTLQEILDAGVDYCTSGNHVFSRKEAYDILDDDNSRLIRPANYPDGNPGKGEKIINVNSPRLSKASQKNILLINLIGRVFMKEDFDCPFKKFDEIISKYKVKDLIGVIVDFHAEATSEKKALANYADGRALAVIGTHTHVPTADEYISKKGTASITDVGAVCALDSVLGVKKEEIIKTFLTQINESHQLPEKGECEFNAVLIKINDKKKQTVDIKRIREIINIK